LKIVGEDFTKAMQKNSCQPENPEVAGKFGRGVSCELKKS
jgi:hypothetical protein